VGHTTRRAVIASKPMTLKEVEEILKANWTGYHDPLCGENLRDGPCGCKLTYLLRAAETVKLFRTVMTCPTCSAPLRSYHSGIMCPICKMYYERDKWWTVACDENHVHSKNCLTGANPCP